MRSLDITAQKIQHSSTEYITEIKVPQVGIFASTLIEQLCYVRAGGSIADTVDPRLSEPRLSETSIIRNLDYPNLDYPNLDYPNLDYPNLDYPNLDYPNPETYENIGSKVQENSIT